MNSAKDDKNDRHKTDIKMKKKIKDIKRKQQKKKKRGNRDKDENKAHHFSEVMEGLLRGDWLSVGREDALADPRDHDTCSHAYPRRAGHDHTLRGPQSGTESTGGGATDTMTAAERDVSHVRRLGGGEVRTRVLLWGRGVTMDYYTCSKAF